MYCTNCSNQLSDNAVTCPNCGHPIKGRKDKALFVLLALFLGGLGIHRFYLGELGLGFLGLLFFWTGIPALVALIEAIVIGFRKNDPRFA